MDVRSKERVPVREGSGLERLDPEVLRGVFAPEEDSLVLGEQVQDTRGKWSKRAPMLLVVLSLIVPLVGLLLDRQEVIYVVLGRHVPGKVTGYQLVDDGDPASFPFGGPYSITYTFTTEDGHLIQGRSGYYSPEVTDPEHQFSVQYLSTDPNTNRPFGQQDWTALYLALAFSIASAVFAFLTYLGRDWYYTPRPGYRRFGR